MPGIYFQSSWWRSPLDGLEKLVADTWWFRPGIAPGLCRCLIFPMHYTWRLCSSWDHVWAFLDVVHTQHNMSVLYRRLNYNVVAETRLSCVVVQHAMCSGSQGWYGTSTARGCHKSSGLQRGRLIVCYGRWWQASQALGYWDLDVHQDHVRWESARILSLQE